MITKEQAEELQIGESYFVTEDTGRHQFVREFIYQGRSTSDPDLLLFGNTISPHTSTVGAALPIEAIAKIRKK